ncbi:ralBP1-associated Eps domain-containing protein 2-like isoform X2 [Daphnia pulicaria]|uniref:ralBP1-associated Eps domain-containing protein 2-like isoform X2 n=1 Tax=Daphnia pulicaria TaxID=35523 RepID=UPI001EEB1AE3|nr:ralBP1-associated Eps domain-containing protein 2-like isoform X2 [Daphnia pulicaria]
MLASSKILPLNVDVETGNHTVNSETDILSTSSPKCHSLVHTVHQPRTRNLHHHARGNKKMPPKSPDLIELSDAGQSPVSVLEDDSSPGVTTDADSEDPSYCDTESPTPTNSAVTIDPKNYWQGAEEHRELLATEGEEEDDDEEQVDQDDQRDIELVDINSSDSEVGTSNNPSSDSDGGNLSYSNDDDIDEEELWKINPDQLSYYKVQFKTLQTDPNGLIGGSQAKQFFEKSRLPTAELSHIWQLSDVTKDGALSLSEFCTAMHLVVLRRNKIMLPKQLPPALDPLQMFEASPQPSLSSAVSTVATTINDKDPHNTQGKPSSSSLQSAVDGSGTAQHWTKFVDSPTGSVASPGPQPVNFDFKRAQVQVEQDPRILHPVALRLTPESQQLSEIGPSSGAVSLPQTSTVNSLGNNLTSHVTSIPSAASIASSSVGKKEPPPPPPPRPYRGHARSSSLDLNQLGRNTGLNSAAPPAVPPRVSPSMGSPRKENESSNQSTGGGAFQVYRRPTGPIAVPVVSTCATPEKKPAVPSNTTSTATKSLTSVIEDHQRRGEVLRKQQQILTKQLFDIQEEKNHLELRLQKLHVSDSQC